MKIYFGAGIQGSPNKEARAERAAVYRELITHIQELGHEVLFEHTATNTKEEVWKVLEKQFGPLPPAGPERGAFIRNRNIEAIETLADAAIFEVSMPSLGVGIELAHAYLRLQMGMRQIPILCLYQKDFWSHGLSIMVSGAINSGVQVAEYSSKVDAFKTIEAFLFSNRVSLSSEQPLFKINHLIIGTSDLDSSVDFYVSVLEFSKAGTFVDTGTKSEGAALKHKSGMELLVVPFSKERLPNPQHIAIQVDKTEFDSIFRRCNRLGLRTRSDAPVECMDNQPIKFQQGQECFAHFYVLDPSMVNIEIMCSAREQSQDK